MKKGTIMISVLLALLLLVGGTTAAQDQAAYVFCGDLAQADCDLLTQSQEAMTNLTSGTSDIELTMTISNIPDMPTDKLAFRVTGNASYAIDPALQDSIKGLQHDPATLFKSPDSFTQWMSALVKGISGDMTLTLELPPELIAMMGTEPALPSTLTIGLRLVDGVGYANLEDIAAAMPNADIPSGWVGADLSALIQALMQRSEFADAMKIDSGALENYMTDLQDPAILSDFMTIERIEDTEVMGQAAATFRTTFDYAAFFRSDMFQQLMSTQMEAASNMTGTELSEEDKAQMQSMMAQMGSMFEGMNLEIRQVIGLQDKYNHATEIHMDWDMAGFMAMSEPNSDSPAPNFTFDIAVHNSSFNNAPAITVPEDATIFPLDSIFSSNA